MQVGELLNQRLMPISVRQLDFIKYEKGKGYYDAHVDAFRASTQWRVISMIAYLNDVRSGGETEFPFVGRSIAPETGKVLIFPSYYGCVHRLRLRAPLETRSVGFIVHHCCFCRLPPR